MNTTTTMRRQPPTLRTRRRQAAEWMRENLPYGKWTCENGREVLFNRRYTPMWERSANGVVTRGDPTERVPWELQEWFYDDGCIPADNEATRQLCEAVLADWGVH